MQDRIRRAILETLIYSDIFDYPLSKDELWKFLTSEKIDKESFEELLKDNLIEKVNFINSFYCLSGRGEIIQTRVKRKKESQKKIVIAKKIIKQLCCIPTIQFIGISGALSLENASVDDDIDLFVITSKGTLWLTRLAMIIVLLLVGRYRRRNQREVSDKICLNMLIDESVLVFPKSRQNLYTAREIVQLMPVFEQNNTYSKFINTNKWVEKFLPNAFKRGITLNTTRNYAETFFSVVLRYILRISALEHLAKTVQLWFIKKHITTETVRNNFLAFHPLDYKNIILAEYKKRLQRYEI